MDHQFPFDKYRKRAELCPCGKSNKDGKFSPFKGFIDKGHCFSCGENFFHVKEKDDSPFNTNFRHELKPKPETKPSYIDLNLFNKSLSYFDRNDFVLSLRKEFRSELVNHAIEKYKIGTSKHWKGATVFWQIDELGNVRTGKIMLFDRSLGKRVKKPFDHINWVHSVLNIPDYKLVQVLFGFHLLKASHNTVAIVEGEKTAIIASICFPDITWLAAGCKDGLKIEKFERLKNRNIILYPDADAYELWNNFAQKHKADFNIKVSSLIDYSLTLDKKSNGDDIADFLLKSIPPHLKANFIQPIITEHKSNPTESPKIDSFTQRNPVLKSLISKLSLETDPHPTSNVNWQNDIAATIIKVGQEIMPETVYHIDEIKALIKKHHSALTINYEKIIRELVIKKVIIKNELNNNHFYKYGSTPF